MNSLHENSRDTQMKNEKENLVMKKRRTARRFLAVCLCLIVVISACACASVDAPSGESTATGESKATSALELSEMNAESTLSEAEPSDEESSQTEPSDEESSESEPSTPEGHISADDDASLPGDITITPIEPTYPEERETTLEKVLSFDIGIDGLFQYDFTFYDDPSSALMHNTGRVYTDGKGIFYYQWAGDLVRLNDGVWFRTGRYVHIDDVEFVGDDLYLLFMDGTVKQYDISEGFESPVLKNTYQVYEQYVESAKLYTIGNSEPIVIMAETREAYTLSGALLKDKNAPFVVQKNIQSVTVQNGVLNLPTAENGCYFSTVAEAGIWTLSSLLGDKVYTMYTRDGNAIARVPVSDLYVGDEVRIDLEFEHDGKIYIKEYYRPCSFTIGNVVFKEVLSQEIFFDSYGTMYLAVDYTDHCDIYRVDAGYTSAKFDTFEPKDEEDSIAPTSGTSETSVSYIIWSGISRSDVEANASKMLKLDWTIKKGNLDVRDNSEVSLPYYLRGRQIGEKLEDVLRGIPYCKGGYNGIGGARDFETVAGTVIDVDGCPTTGNVADVVGNEPGTIGLDCARFVCKALDYHSSNATFERDGLSPADFMTEYANVGHWYRSITSSNVNSIELKPWDVIVNGHMLCSLPVK